MSDDLRLNSIERFSKKSQRLILEEYGSCEVPAGCGGVVLRWNGIENGLRANVRIDKPTGEVESFFNGEPVGNSRARIPFGVGIFALHFTELEAGFDWLVVTVQHSAASWGQGREKRVLHEVSSCQGSQWLWTDQAPPGNWNALDYDDSDWLLLAPSQMKLEDLEEKQRWKYRMQTDDFLPLGLPPKKEIWIRRRYQLDSPAPMNHDEGPSD